MNPAQLHPARLLALCAAGAVLVQLELWRVAGQDLGLSAIFRFLLMAYDAHGNWLLLALAAAAFVLRHQPGALAAVAFAAAHPWRIAAALLPLFCLGAWFAYHRHPLAMDEYAPVFQATAFAAGRVSGALPPELLDQLVPKVFQGHFWNVVRGSGEIRSSYLPGFALLLAPFAWLGLPWVANPVIGALTIPALHRVALLASGSRESAGWAVLLCAASPVFVLSAISYYAMAAHLLLNAVFAALLLQPSVPRALLAGLAGSLALTLHNPVPHLLFALPFLGWLAWRRDVPCLAALLAAYLPLALLLGPGWHFLNDLAAPAAAAAPSAPAAAAASQGTDRLLALPAATFAAVAKAFVLPGSFIIEARLAGLSKAWTWAAPGLLLLAAWGFALARQRPAVRLLGASLALTFVGYFFLPFDQGHGWGYRYLHSAWFALPVLAALPFAAAPAPDANGLRAMVAWAAVLSLIAANSLRLVQAEAFISRQLAQVPPLARAPAAGERDVVFVNLSGGFYRHDLVQNDPFLRGPRIVMIHGGAEVNARLMATVFPGYTRRSAGPWGEHWVSPNQP